MPQKLKPSSLSFIWLIIVHLLEKNHGLNLHSTTTKVRLSQFVMDFGGLFKLRLLNFVFQYEIEVNKKQLLSLFVPESVAPLVFDPAEL